MMISFDTTKKDMLLITEIIHRVEKNTRDIDRLSLDMDITATHCNGCPLNLKKLLAAPYFDFWHDISGIVKHIDRETGKLRNCFVPRSAV